MCQVLEIASSPWVRKEWGPESLVANIRQTSVVAGRTVEMTSPEVMEALKKQEKTLKTLGRTQFPKDLPIR